MLVLCRKTLRCSTWHTHTHIYTYTARSIAICTFCQIFNLQQAPRNAQNTINGCRAKIKIWLHTSKAHFSLPLNTGSTRIFRLLAHNLAKNKPLTKNLVSNERLLLGAASCGALSFLVNAKTRQMEICGVRSTCMCVYVCVQVWLVGLNKHK